MGRKRRVSLKRLTHWFLVFLTAGCATATTTDEGADDEMTQLPGTGGEGAGSGGVVMGSGGVVLGSSGGATSGGMPGSGGVVIGGDGDGDTGGGLIGDGDTGGMPADTGGASGDGDTGGMTASGGSASLGSPGACLLDWDTTPEADACLNAGQDDRVTGCSNLLDCWQSNDCTPAECSAQPEDTCGQNVVMNATPGRTYADDVYAALCP